MGLWLWGYGYGVKKLLGSLVLGIAGHPPGPSHFTACIKRAMPLEPPQLLDRHVPHGVIHEHALDAPGVAVKRKVLHLMPGTLPVAVVVARHEPAGGVVVRAAPAPHGVHEHWDVVQVKTGGVDYAPMPLHVSVLDRSWRVVEPVVVAVTGPGGNGLPEEEPVLEGGVPTADHVPIIMLVFLYRL